MPSDLFSVGFLFPVISLFPTFSHKSQRYMVDFSQNACVRQILESAFDLIVPNSPADF